MRVGEYLPTKPKGFKVGITVYAAEDIHGLITPDEKGVIVPKGTKGKMDRIALYSADVDFEIGGGVLCTYDMVTLQKLVAKIDTDVPPLPPYTIGQVIENTPWRSPDGKIDSGWKPYKVLDLRPGGVMIDLGNNDLWVKAENCRPTTAVCDKCNLPNKLVLPDAPVGKRLCWECFERIPTHCKCGRKLSLAEVENDIPCWKCQNIDNHYQQIKDEAWIKIRAKGISLNDRVIIAWGYKPDEIATIRGYGDTNPAWVIVEMADGTRSLMHINALTKLNPCTAIIPVSGRVTLIEVPDRIRPLPPIRMIPVRDTAQRVPEPRPVQMVLF